MVCIIEDYYLINKKNLQSNCNIVTINLLIWLIIIIINYIIINNKLKKIQFSTWTLIYIYIKAIISSETLLRYIRVIYIKEMLNYLITLRAFTFRCVQSAWLDLTVLCFSLELFMLDYAHGIIHIGIPCSIAS